MNPTEVEMRVIRAVDQLLREDAFLLERDANERSITHRLAVHLTAEFPDRHVDCEYNRDGYEPKRLSLPRRTNIASDDEHATTIFPDVIVHRRGTNDENLVVIEAKKSTSNADIEWDKTKLRAFRALEQLGYTITVFLWLETGTSTVAATLEFADGRKVRLP